MKPVLADRAILNLEICDNTSERIEYRVEDQSLERCIRISLWRRYALYYRSQDFGDTDTGLSAGTDDLLTLASQKILRRP